MRQKRSLRTMLLQIVIIPTLSVVIILLGVILLSSFLIQREIVGSAEMMKPGWVIVVTQPIIVPARSLIIIIGCAVVAFGFGLIMFLMAQKRSLERITKPISTLVQKADILARGQYENLPTEDIGEFEEIASLDRSFSRMVDAVQERDKVLEQRVVDRTERLQIIANLSEHLSAILDVEQLLKEIVHQVKDMFGYYHVHIYLFDENRERLVVAEGTGEAGAMMKTKGHHIPVGKRTSIVAHAARIGQIIRIDNVRETEGWFPNPLLPDTYSEMAVPIILDNRVVGVLDVQEDEVAGLDDSDENLMRSLANQIAISIRNARLFNETEKALAELRAYQEQYIEQSWKMENVRRRNDGRAQFSLGESTTLQETIVNQVRQQILEKQAPSVIKIEEDTPGAVDVWGFPIVLDKTAIGTLQLYGVDRQWSAGELALIEAVIDQVAQNAESIRLVSEIQERAGRQRIISRIGDKLRSAPDIDTLMEITMSELSQILKPARTFISLDNDNG